MKIFHMQIHPEDKENALNYATEALNSAPPIIGLDFKNVEGFSMGLNEFSDQDFQSLYQQHRIQHGDYGTTGILRDFYNLSVNDIGLIRAPPSKPFALVKIIGNYIFEEKIAESAHLWFRHRFPVEILGYYDQDLQNGLVAAFEAPNRGTFQILNNENRPTYQAISKWYKTIERRSTMDKIKELIMEKRQIIFTGPPGTGKTREAKRLAYYLLTDNMPGDNFETEFASLQNLKVANEARGAWELIQFHPSYNYDDFIRGIRIRTIGGQPHYKTEDGPLLALANAANLEENKDKKFILIIDEINRANVAAVLGEMLYALEYRNQPVSLQYAKETATSAPNDSATTEDTRRIALPDNLFIIGTMNTADRSIGHLDYAVRRRFAFIQLKPDIEVLNMNPEGVRQLSKKAFNKVATLFPGQISADYNADDVQPGHSYFIVKLESELKQRMKYEVVPLLREYLADGVLKQTALEIIEKIESGDWS